MCNKKCTHELVLPNPCAVDITTRRLEVKSEPSTDNTYNGWSNYATWLVNIQFAQDYGWQDEVDDDVTYNSVEDLAIVVKDQCEVYLSNEDDLEPDHRITIAREFALAFLSDVNWKEIAEAIASNYPSLIKS